MNSSEPNSTPGKVKIASTSARNSPSHNVAEELIQKTPKRVLGISRKFLLRTINRKVIARIARRATIGIPLVGMYFAQRAFRNDLAEAQNIANPAFIRSGYKVVTSIDGIDLLAQSAIIASLATSMLAPTAVDVNNAFHIPEIMLYGDKISIGCALSSTLLGTYIELKREHMIEEANVLTQHLQQQAQNVSSTNDESQDLK